MYALKILYIQRKCIIETSYLYHLIIYKNQSQYIFSISFFTHFFNVRLIFTLSFGFDQYIFLVVRLVFTLSFGI